MRRLRGWIGLGVALGVCAPALAQPASQVLEMWDGQDPPQGTVTSVDLQGVSVMLGDGTITLLDWTQVRDVSGARGQEFAAFRDDARAIWRASVRLERGDLVNAEPLLEDLFARTRFEQGAASSFVARGLMRARLAGGARAPAIAPWLGVLGAERWAPGGDASDDPSTLIDPATGLAPSLAPIWLDNEQSAWLVRHAVAQAPETGARPGAGRMRQVALSTLYRVSALYESDPGDGEAIRREIEAMYEQIDPDTLSEAGVSLVLEIVLSRVGGAEQRASAQTALRARLRKRPSVWHEAWIRTALGRSMILDDNPEIRGRGVIQLLHVPARFERAAPGLASVALAEAAVTMRSLGEGEAAGSLRRELLERFPDSEGARWDAIRDWGRGAGALTGASWGESTDNSTGADGRSAPEGNGRS